MTEQELLLATIINNSGDNVPRLVYADWLLEHADDTNGFTEQAHLIQWACGVKNESLDMDEIETAVKSQLCTPLTGIKLVGVYNAATPGCFEVMLDVPSPRLTSLTFFVGMMRDGFISWLFGVDVNVWRKLGMHIVGYLPIQTVHFANIDTHLHSVIGGQTRCVWADYIPWLKDSVGAVHENIEVAEAWASGKAITWAKKNRKRYLKNGRPQTDAPNYYP